MAKPRQAEVERQLRRLAGLSGYREAGPDGIAELGEALMACAASDDHAEQIVSTWVRANRWMPTPADFFALGEASRYEQEAPRPGARCKACAGSGFTQAWMLTSYTRHPNGETKNSETVLIDRATYQDLRHKVDGIGQRVDEGVVACQCDYGQRLLAARVAKAAETESKRQGRAA